MENKNEFNRARYLGKLRKIGALDKLLDVETAMHQNLRVYEFKKRNIRNFDDDYMYYDFVKSFANLHEQDKHHLIWKTSNTAYVCLNDEIPGNKKAQALMKLETHKSFITASFARKQYYKARINAFNDIYAYYLDKYKNDEDTLAK